MILGINGLNHDASMALIDGRNIVWAAHSERYSRIKNDSNLNSMMVKELYQYGTPEEIIWFENPILKSLRKFYSQQHPYIINPKDELKKLGLNKIPLTFVTHHKSHAAAGYFTSSFNDASVLVVDAVGEWDTVSIWHAENNDLKKIYSKKYPNSIGLFYTAFTDYLGLKPNEEEYILMGMAAFGRPSLANVIKKDFFEKFNPPEFKLKHNLHRGCKWWKSPKGYSYFDIAASVQAIMEEYLLTTSKWMLENIPTKNFIFMGGCALNCVANSIIAKKSGFKNFWIMPNPGDAGSAIGSVAAYKQQKLHWQGPFLGTNIDRPLDLEAIVNELLNGKVVAVANGRAEFGPRALGNRSLLCDPRGVHAKALMNKIKQREQFRPFAPAVLHNFAKDYFDMPVYETPYMQYVAKCKFPKDLPGICHVDGTSRVQTVNSSDNKNFFQLLQLWYEKTGCPMLMNTSLNIKGEPLVNDIHDAIRWEQINGVKVF